MRLLHTLSLAALFAAPSAHAQRAPLPQDRSIDVHLVDASSNPIQAEVRVYRRLQADPERWMLDTTGTTDDHGNLHVPVLQAGHYRLYSLAANVGTAVSKDLILTDARESLAVPLQLAGRGELAGIVVDEAGVPVPYLPIRATAESRRGRRFEDLWGSNSLPDFADDGLQVLEVLTEIDGTFHFGGLREGRYELDAYARSTQVGAAPGAFALVIAEETLEPLTEQPVATGTLDLELVSKQRRMTLRILDHAGDRLWVELGFHRRRSELPEHALYVLEADCDGQVIEYQRDAIETPRWRLPNGDITVIVESGREYVVGVVSRSNPLVESRIATSPGTSRPERTLIVPAADPDTTFSVTVSATTESSSKPIAGLSTHHELRAPTSNALLWDIPNLSSRSGEPYAVGAGVYRLSSRYQPSSFCGTGAPVRHAKFCPTTSVIELPPGQHTSVEQTLPLSGSVRLTLHCADPPPLPPKVDDDRAVHFISTPFEERHRKLRAWNGGARIELHTADEVIVPRFDLGPARAWIGAAGSQGLAAPWAPLNHTVTSSSAILPGRYRLVVSCAGLVSVEREIEVRAEQSTLVDLHLERQLPR